LTSALVGRSSQRHVPAAIYTRERNPCTHWIGSCGVFRADLDTEAIGKVLCSCRGLNPGRLVCSQKLYSLSYPSFIYWKASLN
jgi:hypothetical protein